MSIELKGVSLIHGFFKPEFFKQFKKSDKNNIVVLEGRPGLEAARASSAQLQMRGIVPTIIADNMAGYLFSKGLVKDVWLAAQANDPKGAMCQIGGLIMAVLAKKHLVPVYIAPAGQRLKALGKSSDLQKFNGQRVVAGKMKSFVPLMEWIPAKYFRGQK